MTVHWALPFEIERLTNEAAVNRQPVGLEVSTAYRSLIMTLNSLTKHNMTLQSPCKCRQYAQFLSDMQCPGVHGLATYS